MKYLLGLIIFITGVSVAQDKKESIPIEVTDELQKMTKNKHAIDEIPIEKLSKRSLEALMDEMFLLSPRERRDLFDKQREQEGVLKHGNKSTEEIHEIIPISTRPENKLENIYLAPYQVSMISVIDSTGEPWPIINASHNHSNFEIKTVDKHSFKNLLKGTVTYGAGTTNLSLALSGLSTIVSVNLVAGDEKYHPAPILQLDLAGPNARHVPVISAHGMRDADVMRSLLIADMPEGFIRLRTDDSNVDAWSHEESLYVRSTYHPSSPHPRSFHYGPNGYGAFKMPYRPVIVMVTDSGIEKSIKISAGEY